MSAPSSFLSSAALPLLSDIHGNHVGFQQVLERLEHMELRQAPVICGDLLWNSYADYDPLAVLALLMRHPSWHVVAGNTDRWFHDNTLESSDPRTERGARVRRRMLELKRQMSDEQLEFLRRLPDRLELDWADRSIYVTHASPLSCDEGLEPSLPDEEYRRRLDRRADDVLITGHLHRSFVHLRGSQMHCSVGAIGKHPEEYDGIVELAFLDTTSQGIAFLPYKLLQDRHPTLEGEARSLQPWKSQSRDEV